MYVIAFGTGQQKCWLGRGGNFVVDKMKATWFDSAEGAKRVLLSHRRKLGPKVLHQCYSEELRMSWENNLP